MAPPQCSQMQSPLGARGGGLRFWGRLGLGRTRPGHPPSRIRNRNRARADSDSENPEMDSGEPPGLARLVRVYVTVCRHVPIRVTCQHAIMSESAPHHVPCHADRIRRASILRTAASGPSESRSSSTSTHVPSSPCRVNHHPSHRPPARVPRTCPGSLIGTGRPARLQPARQGRHAALRATCPAPWPAAAPATPAADCYRLQQTATGCNRLQQDATGGIRLQQAASDCNRLQHL